MGGERILEHVKTALIVILVVLIFYLLIVMWIYFSGSDLDSGESVVAFCSNAVMMNHSYEFCCSKRNVLVRGDEVQASCYEIRANNLLDGIPDFDCSGVSCSG